MDGGGVPPPLAPQGRGRGRGGSGVSILPEGMWESMRTDAEPSVVAVPEIAPPVAVPGGWEEPVGGVGRGDGGRGRGRGRGRGDDFLIRPKAPIFKKGDWECHICTNMNWSWRSECNVCKTARLGGPEPEGVRDGAGGGFNERQQRASITLAAEVAEDGFDDFGRRAKGNRSDRQKREEAALARLRGAYGFLMNNSDLPQLPERDRPRNEVVEVVTIKDDDDRPSKRSSQDDRDKSKKDRRDRGDSKERGRERSRSRERNRDRDRERSRDRLDRRRDKDDDRDRRDRDDDKDRRDRDDGDRDRRRRYD